MSVELKQHNENAKQNKISLEEKIQILEKFSKTEEKLISTTIFEGYPVGKWSIQIRSLIKRQKEGKDKRVRIKITEEQLERLDALGMLDRKIEATIDEKIELLIEWMSKYPQAEIRQNIPEDILRNYATTEEEYLSIVTQYQNMQKYYEYIRQRKSYGKLTEEQISKCKEGNVRGVFGYPTIVEELAKKTGESKEKIDYIISNYGTMEHFVKLYKNEKQNELPNLQIRNLASSMLRNTIDIDLSPNSKEYDALYADIMDIKQEDNILELYSSEKLKAQLETFSPKEKYIIERRYGLLPDDLPRELQSIASEIGTTKNTVYQIQCRILRKLKNPRRVKQFRYNFGKSAMLTEDECRIIDDLKDNLYSSYLIFRNNPHISNDDKDILKAFEIIKNMDEITEERRKQKEKQSETTEASNEDTFIKYILENATKRVEVKKKSEQAKELAEKYEKAFGKKASKDR